MVDDKGDLHPKPMRHGESRHLAFLISWQLYGDAPHQGTLTVLRASSDCLPAQRSLNGRIVLEMLQCKLEVQVRKAKQTPEMFRVVSR